MMTKDLQSAKRISQSAVLAALTGVGAWIAIPLAAVPITLQGFFVYLTGLLLPPLWAGFAMLLYLAMGLVGLPVYAQGGSGLGVVIGPTGGYLFGFIIGASILSLLVDRTRKRAESRRRVMLIVSTVPAVLVCSAIVLTVGATWGKVATGLEWSAIIGGWVLPFLPGDVIKMTLAIIIATELWRRGALGYGTSASSH